MKHGTIDLLKFKKLQRRLKLPKRRDAIGLLESMWIFAQKNCPRGDIGKFDNETIAIELEWDGEPDDLVAALVDSEWLDENAKCRLYVHDWHEHAPRWVHGVCAKLGGMVFSQRLQTASTVGECSGQPPNLTQPNVTLPHLTLPDGRRMTDDEFWKQDGMDQEVRSTASGIRRHVSNGKLGNDTVWLISCLDTFTRNGLAGSIIESFKSKQIHKPQRYADVAIETCCNKFNIELQDFIVSMPKLKTKAP